MARLQKKQSSDAKRKKRLKAETAESTEMATGVKKAVAVPKKSAEPGAWQALAAKKPNFLNQAIQFLREVRIELKKVTWPTRKQTFGSTVVVIILVMIISVFLGVADFGLNNLIRVVLQ